MKDVRDREIKEQREERVGTERKENGRDKKTKKFGNAAGQ